MAHRPSPFPSSCALFSLSAGPLLLESLVRVVTASKKVIPPIVRADR